MVTTKKKICKRKEKGIKAYQREKNRKEERERGRKDPQNR